jgi:hypothetical protein
MIVFIPFRISSMNGITSPTCTCTKCRLHFCAILMNVSHAMSCTPSCVSVKGKKNLKKFNQHDHQITCTTNLHFISCATRKFIQKVNLPCINSKSLLTTVLRNLQWARRNRGYCPTTYIMLEATIALLSFPLFCSVNPSRSCSMIHSHP